MIKITYINNILDMVYLVDSNWYYQKSINNLQPDIHYPLKGFPHCVSCIELEYYFHNIWGCINRKCIYQYGSFSYVVSYFL